MAAKFYLGERFEHTHENQAFDQLCQLVEEHWSSQDESVCLIGNVTCEGHELDALLIKENAITVIDFKNFGGELTFSENGPWYADGKEVKGGGKVNPYKQIHANKFAVLNWFQRMLPEIAEANELGHISGLVLFQQEITFDDKAIPPRVKSWFSAGDFSSGFAWLAHLASPRINIKATQQAAIISMLGVMDYQPIASKTTTQLTGINNNLETIQPTVSWTREQTKVISLFNQFLEQPDSRFLLISGMTSTGKKTVLSELISRCGKEAKISVLLAPNATICKSLEASTGKEFSSIYTHIYNTGVEKKDKNIVYNPIRKCEDGAQAVYFIAGAQLLSDNYFELDNKRFGSGKTFSDFLEFIDFKGKPDTKIVVVGDPYQLLVKGSMVDLELYDNHQIPLISHEITEAVGNPSENSKLKLAIDLVQSLRTETFNRLEIEPQDSEVVVLSDDDSERRGAYKDVYSDPFLYGRFLSFSHKRVSDVTWWGRRSLLGRTSTLPVQGDILELRNKIIIKDRVSSEDFYPGAYFKVLSVGASQLIKDVELKGREQPIRLVFRTVNCVALSTSHSHELLFLEDFLLAEKPELSADQLVALKVLADQEVRKDGVYKELSQKIKESSDNQDKEELEMQRQQRRDEILSQSIYQNAAFFRYGYGSTCHQARGRKWSTVVVDASYEDNGRNNEEYFRWLYTAITRAENTVYLDKFVPITPWSKLNIKSDRVQITPNIKTRWNFYYPKNQKPSEAKLGRALPEGLENPQLELVNLWLYCSKKLAEIGCVVQQVKHHQYQERYVITDAQGQEHVLAIHYNGSFEVTNIRAEQTDNSSSMPIVNHLKGKVSFASKEANQVLEMVANQLNKISFTVEGGKEANWLLLLNLIGANNRKAAIKVYYNKDGFISTIEIDKATDTRAVDEIYEAFGVVRE